MIDKVKEKEVEALLNGLFPRREIRRVLLVNPPDADTSFFQYETALRKRYTNYPPYGLAVLAKTLTLEGIEVRVTNLNHEVLKRCIESANKSSFDFDKSWQSKLDQDILDFQPDLIGVSCMFTMTHESLKKVCVHASSGYAIPLAIGGVHVTNDVERVLDDIPEADIAFLREGDVVFKTFVQSVNNQQDYDQLAQVILNDKLTGTRYHFPADKLPSPKDMDIIPSFELLDIEEYSDYGTIGAFYCFKPESTRFATVLSNRGCRGQCTFCSVRNFNGKNVRQRSIDSVVDELELLENDYGVEHIMWLDDDLLRDHKRTIGMFNEMVKRGLNLTWDATNGVIASSCTDEVIAAAFESGCIALNIGMESGNPGILRQIKKPGTVKAFLKAAEILRKYDQIHSSLLLMVGFPNETMSMIFDTIKVAREMDLDWCRISPLQPLPNTPIYDSMVAQGVLQDTGSKELRFQGGSYGKQAEIEAGNRLASVGFEEAFSSIPLDEVPSGDQITDIWFYMNYHLNFHRLFNETRQVKVEQQLKHLSNLSDVISPENGFALYFHAYLQKKFHKDFDQSTIIRLKQRLSSSSYWQDRFRSFGLSIDDHANSLFHRP